MDMFIRCTIIILVGCEASSASHLYMSRSLESESIVDRDKMYQSSADFDKDTLEKLDYGLYLFSSTGLKVNDMIKAGEDVSVYCIAKVNRRATCFSFGSCPSMKFEWNFPLSLSESIKVSNFGLFKPSAKSNNLRDVRIFIDSDPLINLQSPDDEVHMSSMTIESIGGIHDGKYLCNFKYFDEINEKMDRNFLQFQLNVQTQNEDEGCSYNDHCNSNNCINGKCVCSIDYPLYDKSSGDCFVPSAIGQECESDVQCMKGVSRCEFDSKCSSFASEISINMSSRISFNCPKVCQCKDNLIPIQVAFNNTICQHMSTMKSPCESTFQCELKDANTFCAFNNVCECKEGKRCREPTPILCAADEECPNDQFCRYERCVSRKRVGQSCTANEECTKTDINTNCVTNKCRCSSGYKPLAAVSSVHSAINTFASDASNNYITQCIKEDACYSHADCFDDHFCKDKKCVEGTKLDAPCQTMIECKAKDVNSICVYETPTTNDIDGTGFNPDYFWAPPSLTTPDISSGICSCRPRYKPSSSVPSICVAEGQCINDNDCSIDSHCVDDKCFDEVGSSCRTSERCVQIMKYSYCHKFSKKCECDSNYEFDKLNGTCEPKECNTRMDCKNKDCINNVCSCPADKDTNEYGYCVDRRVDKEPSDDKDMRGEYSFLDDLQRIFTEWKWEAFVIIAGVSFFLILTILIIVVVVRLIMIKRQMAKDREAEEAEDGNQGTTQPLNSDAVTDYID